MTPDPHVDAKLAALSRSANDVHWLSDHCRHLLQRVWFHKIARILENLVYLLRDRAPGAVLIIERDLTSRIEDRSPTSAPGP